MIFRTCVMNTVRISSPDAKAVDQNRHAIALFRGRTATDQDKRSAVAALAHVLERRRTPCSRQSYYVATRVPSST